MPALFTISTVAGVGGAVTPINPSVVQGQDQTITFVPAAGYRVDIVTMDGVVVTPTTPLTLTYVNVQSDHTLNVSFHLIDYINHIADGLVTMLKTINGPVGGYTADFSSATIERAPTLLDWTTVRRPYLGVRFDAITEQVPFAFGQYRISGDFIIGFLIDINGTTIDRAAPERLGAIYAQDIMRCIALDVNMAGILASGIAQPGPVTVSQDPNLGMMMAYGSVTVGASWIWTI